jgi:hypothetical protein
MNQIAHVTGGRVKLMGGRIVTPYELRHEIADWALMNNVEIEYHGSLLKDQDLWYVKNDQHRAWFILRWA